MELSVKAAPKTYDVIVAGGGPAGVLAAVAAARQGADTLLIEGSTALGGMSTSGLVPSWSPFDDQEKCIYWSLTTELLDRYKAMVELPSNGKRWTAILAEPLKRLYDEMTAEAGVTVLLQTTLCHAVTENGTIRSVVVANKAGLTEYRAKTFVDCTGDGDLAAMSGVPMEYGDETGYVQEASLCFVISGVQKDKITRAINSNPEGNIWIDAIKSGKYPHLVRHFIPKMCPGGIILANAGGLPNVDATDPMAVSKAYALGRLVAAEYLAALKEYQPEAFADAMILQTAPLLGVRESRRIVGDYVLTAEDYFARRSFPDEICRNSYWLDCHLPEGRENPCEPGGKQPRYGPGESHGIPWRSLIPKNVENLLVAGRCVSMDNIMLATIRVMPNCHAMGEAAGIGAAVAAKRGVPVRQVSVDEVRAGWRR